MIRGDSFDGGHTGDPERDLAYERDYKRRGFMQKICLEFPTGFQLFVIMRKFISVVSVCLFAIGLNV